MNEQTVNTTMAEHIQIYVKHELLEALKTGYQSHYLFDEPRPNIKTGDVLKFQKVDTPDYITKRVGAVEHKSYKTENGDPIMTCTVVTLLAHKEKGFAQPFQQTGDRYRAAFFSRNQGR